MATSPSSAMAPSRSGHNSKMDGGDRALFQQQPQQAQQQTPSAGYHRFGPPDSRASYSERRLVQHGGRTAHSHPWSQQQQQHHANSDGTKTGRSFSVAMSALSRSNGSLAVNGLNEPTDANGNSKLRPRTQVLFCSLTQLENGEITFTYFLTMCRYRAVVSRFSKRALLFD